MTTETKIGASLRECVQMMALGQFDYNHVSNEILKAARILDVTAATLRHLTPDKYPYTAFITGQSKEVDEHNLPLTLRVCPAYGADFSVTYELKK